MILYDTKSLYINGKCKELIYIMVVDILGPWTGLLTKVFVELHHHYQPCFLSYFDKIVSVISYHK